jgi:hypothetical protein
MHLQSKNIKLVITLVVFTSILLWGLSIQRECIKQGSAVRWLFKSSIEKIDEYKLQHGHFPRSLNELHWSKFEEGANKTYLTFIHYESDGDTYSLRARIKCSNEQLVKKTNNL